jgi:hypothetical protein
MENVSILQSNLQELLPALKEGVHYRVVNQNTMNLLLAWYGGGPILERQYVDVDSTPQVL